MNEDGARVTWRKRRYYGESIRGCANPASFTLGSVSSEGLRRGSPAVELARSRLLHRLVEEPLRHGANHERLRPAIRDLASLRVQDRLVRRPELDAEGEDVARLRPFEPQNHHLLPKGGEAPGMRVVARGTDVDLDLLAVRDAAVEHHRSRQDRFERGKSLGSQVFPDLPGDEVVREVEVESKVGNGLGILDRSKEILCDQAAEIARTHL